MRQKLFLLFFALCSFCQYTFAQQQKATVTSFTKTTDHISIDDRKTDNNGNFCALVKIQCLDDIDRIEGTKIGDIINKGVEKWIYMCKGSSWLKIHFKNHVPLRVDFRNYRVNRLESNVVYELVLDTPNGPKQDAPKEERGILQMRVTPSNANIYVWGNNYEKTLHRAQDDGTLMIELPYGRYYYSVTANGYNDLEGNVFVNDEDKWEEVTMIPLSGTIIIKCPTKKVDFSIDGQLVDKDKSETMWYGRLPAGQHEIQAIRKGYVTQAKIIIINPNETTEVVFDELITEFEQAVNEKKRRREEKKRENRLQGDDVFQ